MADELILEIEEIHDLLRAREGGRGDLQRVLKARRRQLPRAIYRQGMALAAALPLLQHPKLQRTVDQAPLKRAVQNVREHLDSIDVADRRKGRFLGLLGNVGASVLLVTALLVVVLHWRGFV